MTTRRCFKARGLEVDRKKSVFWVNRFTTLTVTGRYYGRYTYPVSSEVVFTLEG